MPTRDLDSYLAGLFDGEGCVHIRHRESDKPGDRPVRTVLTVSVQMKTPGPLQLLHQRFGGSIVSYKKANGVMYHWYISGTNAREALELFAELCVVKDADARIGLDLVPLLAEVGTATGKRPKGKRCVPLENLRARRAIQVRISNIRNYANT